MGRKKSQEVCQQDVAFELRKFNAKVIRISIAFKSVNSNFQYFSFERKKKKKNHW